MDVSPSRDFVEGRARRRWGGGARAGKGDGERDERARGRTEGEGRRERSSWFVARASATRAVRASGGAMDSVGRGLSSSLVVNVNVVRRLDDERER